MRRRLGELTEHLQNLNAEKLVELDVLHYPDLQFFKLCYERFGVNRGVFNTIDNWLYEHGATNVYSRRKLVIDFLHYAVRLQPTNERTKFIKFGQGTLTTRLMEFVISTKHYA